MVEAQAEMYRRGKEGKNAAAAVAGRLGGAGVAAHKGVATEPVMPKARSAASVASIDGGGSGADVGPAAYEAQVQSVMAEKGLSYVDAITEVNKTARGLRVNYAAPSAPTQRVG